MRASRSFTTLIASAIALAFALGASPAVAGYPGSTQPGAQPVPPGNFIILRDVPARNAIIPGAGAALSVATAPPSTVFESIQGVGSPLTDAQAALMTGSIAPGRSGQAVSAAIDGVLGSQSMVGGAAADHSGATRVGGVGGAIAGGMESVRSALGILGGAGH